MNGGDEEVIECVTKKGTEGVMESGMGRD